MTSVENKFNPHNFIFNIKHIGIEKKQPQGANYSSQYFHKTQKFTNWFKIQIDFTVT